VNDFAELFLSGEPEPVPEPVPEADSPPWFGPPEDELGTCLPVSLVVGRSENGVIALRSIAVFSTGLSLDLFAVARGISLSKVSTFFHEQHNFGSEDGIPDGLIRVGLKYDDGTRVSNISDRRRAWQTEGEPDGPVLVNRHGGSSQGGGGRVTMTQTHWLWPLPPAAPLELFVEWPALDVSLSSTQLDGRAIAQAAAQSQSLWS
jgi:hypothetical protein